MDDSVQVSDGFPEELSNCSVYLDLFHYCSSAKGRIRDYYRTGKTRTCMPYWNDFWFCIKIKAFPKDIAKEKYMERRKSLPKLNSAKSFEPSPDQAGVWELRKSFKDQRQS